MDIASKLARTLASAMRCNTPGWRCLQQLQMRVAHTADNGCGFLAFSRRLLGRFSFTLAIDAKALWQICQSPQPPHAVESVLASQASHSPDAAKLGRRPPAEHANCQRTKPR